MRAYPSFFLFPQSIALRSPLSPARVEEILRENTDARSIPWFSKMAFHGKVKDGQFTISRIIRGKNSFKPELVGKIEADVLGGSRLEITLRLHVIVYLFLLVWMPPWFLVPFGGLVAAIGGETEALGLVLVPLFPALIIVIFHLAFVSEGKRSLTRLGELVQAEPIGGVGDQLRDQRQGALDRGGAVG